MLGISYSISSFANRVVSHHDTTRCRQSLPKMRKAFPLHFGRASTGNLVASLRWLQVASGIVSLLETGGRNEREYPGIGQRRT